MEILFILISLILSVIFTYITSRIFFTNKELLQAYKENIDLTVVQLILALMLASSLFITLAALNNTFWHLPYLFTN